MEEEIKKLLVEKCFEDLKGMEGRYLINRDGELWSKCQNKLLTPSLNEGGYFYHKLTGGSVSNNLLHRLLAIQFIENPNSLLEIDHIDRSTTNNLLHNLRWVSRTQNQNNKSNNLKELNEEQKEQKVQELKEYKRLWAEKNRREKGIQEKKHLTEEEKKAYKAEWMRLKRANMSQEERDAINAKRREARKK